MVQVMKLYKLIVHNKTFSAEDLIINPKDFPTFRKGDIAEIYHPEDEFSRLLLQITSFKEDLQGRETISVEQSIATAFQLRTYADVYMKIVDPESVALDSVELIFKDQYLSRSEMYRLKNSLVNTCVYVNKKIDFCGGSARCQVYEMWSSGDKVACGVITNHTKVVFRSSTSLVYLFIQMSSEMWDFDIHGDLYFEKAVNGFLSELFNKWKKHGSNHEVTIVLFSRLFYSASSLDDFPQFMRDCLQQDYKGRYYEDFYRVVIQNERCDDWSHTLIQLRRLFTEYQQSLLDYHVKPKLKLPSAVVSTAAQGNFLEVLNTALNVFERHYLERSFDRTGQLAVVVTPGVGVFDVDRKLTNVTKQRIIDNGIGCDLVCVGEQPLHAVPLLKFNNKDPNISGDFCMPHWINLSFFSSNKRVAYSNFTPRIKLPPRSSKADQHRATLCIPHRHNEPPLPTTEDEYDAYDDEVFDMTCRRASRGSHLTKKASDSVLEGKMSKRKLSDPDVHHLEMARSPSVGSLPSPPGVDISATPPQIAYATADVAGMKSRGGELNEGSSRLDELPEAQSGLSHSLPSSKPSRGLINPFDPSHVTIKLTSNRRRWSHIFPKGPSGLLIQQHHYQTGPTIGEPPGPFCSEPRLSISTSQGSYTDNVFRGRSSVSSVAGTHRKNQALVWGVTGEQEWSPALTTGVDWKSLTIPACLPITTDYFPDEVCLETDYLFSDYNLLPDDVNADYAQQRAVYRKPLTTAEVFHELVSQRLSQGFQLIVDGAVTYEGGASTGSAVVGPRSQDIQPSTEFKLSIGRVFHRIVLCGSEIRVTRYRPRHPYPPFNVNYLYRFQGPDCHSYEMCWISFKSEKLETYNWNYLDHYICTRGDTDFALAESLKYWRFRVYVLPGSAICGRNKGPPEAPEYCDVHSPMTLEEQTQYSDTFLRFIETWINKIRRPVHKKTKLELASLNQTSQLTRRRHSMGYMSFSSQTSMATNSPFRERLGSNRLPDKFRPRSGSKGIEKGQSSLSADNTSNDSEHSEAFDDTLSAHGEVLMLKEGVTHPEIVESMKLPNLGLSFLSPHASLPGRVFVSADAVAWVQAHVENVTSHQLAIKLLEELREDRLICHASGDFSRPFVSGFHLYHIVNYDANIDEPKPLRDLESFENEWLEVEVRQPVAPTPVPLFLRHTLPPYCHDTSPGPQYKHTHMEVDVQAKSGRVEWGHCRYRAAFAPDRAYELVVQWAVASGAIVCELITGWARKAQGNGLLMIPIPPDPFALPFSAKTEPSSGDPLRGPAFIPLDTESLMGTRSYLFQEFPEETWGQRLMFFQEAIATKFGFIRCSVDANAQHQSNHHHQYIHMSGIAFLMVPSVGCEHELVYKRRRSSSRSVSVRRPTPNPLPLLGTTPCPRLQENADPTRVGFLWSWNHMVSRRWKWSSGPAKSDDAFHSKLLADFRNFCSNSNNRLKMFWDTCWNEYKANQGA